MPISLRDRLIVALDLPDVRAAEGMVEKLGDAVSFYKVGFELALAGGIPFAQALARSGKKVFLDLKLHDIANTVARATERAAGLGATLLSVHAFPPTMRAAVEGRGKSALKLLAVTVLTSWAAEAAALRSKIGSMLLVTPGIRPAGEAAGDQKRIVTPKAAIAAGADHLVVGRPVLAARDPQAAAETIVAEIASALN